ncbi:serine/threonine-protein phosphatase 4 regulatory subunit 1, partial [Phenoliferia sp. Uapishka_3]
MDGPITRSERVADLPLPLSLPTPSSTPSAPVTRGRPRSTSISNGSPGPSPGGSTCLPSLFPLEPPTHSSSWPSRSATSSNGVSGIGASLAGGSGGASGWGHRASLSVPGIVAPLALAPGSVNRLGRHRRTQSVSPPGFPTISELADQTPTAPNFASTPAVSAAPTQVDKQQRRRESPNRDPARPIAISTRPTRLATATSSTSSPSSSPHSPSSILPAHSPTSPHHAGHQHAVYPSSHAALLSGVRSHALPHSPTFAASADPPIPFSSHLAMSSPSTSATIVAASKPRRKSWTPQSPPFGPTPPTTSHSPSPLGVAIPRGSPEMELDAVVSGMRRDDLMEDGEDMYGADGQLPGAFGDLNNGLKISPMSPPLLPLPLPPLSPPSSLLRPEDQLATFGRDSPHSPVSLYLGRDPPTVPLGQCDLRNSPQEQRATSPPPSPPLFSQSKVLPPPAATPVCSPSPTTPGSAVVTRARARSFTSDRNFAPAPSPPSPPDIQLPSTDSVLPPLVLPPLANLSSPPQSPPTIPLSLHYTSDFSDSDFVAPPSPHHSTISLPPPPVAPAPLPAHLGGPVLHHPRHLGSKLARAHSTTLAEKIAAEPGSKFVPKRHSPLASPALATAGDDEEERRMDSESEEEKVGIDGSDAEEVARALEDAGTTEMDLGVVQRTLGEGIDAGVSRALSPLGQPEHHEISRAEEAEDETTPPPGTGQEWGWGISLGESSTSAAPFADDKGSESSSPLCRSNVDAPNGDADLGSLPPREERARSVSPPPVITLVDPVVDPVERRSQFGALGFMDVDGSESALGLHTGSNAVTERTLGEVPSHGHGGHGHEPSEDGGEVISIDEESLSSLERIFVCAKSSAAEERARVAHNLADWLATVSMEEAVEYVLPLLAGLATDTEEVVKEVFAPQLDRIMWHFFSQCPLIELDCPEGEGDADAAHDNASPAGSPVPSRYTPLPPAKPSPTSTHFVSEDSGSADYTPPTTSKTSPSNTEVSDAPRISATTFTSLLGALLTDQSTVVANSTQSALVRFLCRLKGKPFPLESPSSPRSPATGLAPFERQVLEATSNHQVPYHLTEEARRVLEDEVVSGIVLGLARLDDDDREDRDERGMDGIEDGQFSMHERSGSRSPLPGSEVENQASDQLVMSPEEEQIEDGWMGAEQTREGRPPATIVETWGEPLVNFFDGPDGETNDYNLLPETSSPAGQVYSSFSPDGGQGDEESAIGKLVSMSLVAAIAATDCLEPDVLANQILPEVDRMKSEQMFYVRKEAATALGSLARTLPIEVFESVVVRSYHFDRGCDFFLTILLLQLPLHGAFARDTLWHVRRAACLSLPTLFKRLPPDLLRAQTIENVVLFGNDESRNVRSGLLEVCGELIYLFHGHSTGVPDEMLAFFLGKLAAPAPAESEDVFAPLPSALDSPPQTFYDSPPSWAPTGSANLYASTSRDPDRPVMCAFNLPAVVLTLGREKWSLIEDYYLTLCRDKADKVRQSLASSMHEVAKIIGPDLADEHLVGPFSWFLHDVEHIQGAVLENLGSLVTCFGPEAARQILDTVAGSWGEIKQWRRREAVAKQLAKVGGHFLLSGNPEEFLSVLVKAFKDPVASVRDNAVYAIPNMLSATETDSLARSKLWAFLSVFSEDSGYRHRTTYTSCALAAVQSGVTREVFESYFLDALSRLARDPVINVRIGVARVVAEACRTASLYAELANRESLEETLHHLFTSNDRDVKGVVAEFCTPAQPDSPPQTGLDRSGALSRLSMYDEEHDDYCLPSANMNRNSFGAGETDMEDVELAEPQDVRIIDRDAANEDMDMDLDDGVDVEAPSFNGGALEGEGEESAAISSAPQNLWTRELEGEESFLEVSRR